jgi:hypothetical protein
MSQYRLLLQKFTALDLSSSTVNEISSMLESVRDWDVFLQEAELHGLSAIILKHANDNNLELPETIKLSLRALLLRHNAHADARYKVAAELLDHFQAAGCPVLFLKGLALSPLIYPSDGLRPMRDIDILIPGKDKTRVAKVIRELGFALPDSHSDKYNRDSHQMPNAWKFVDGFKISVEVHHDAIERDAPGHLYYEDISPRQSVQWRDIVFETLNHEQMLDQLCRHLVGRHPGSILKLINVADIVLYSEKYIDQIDWSVIKDGFPHIINTLKCLHLAVPLSDALQEKIGGVNDVQLEGVGEIMPILKDVVYANMPVSAKLRALFLPSDWWLHLYYVVPPNRSLLSVKLWRHPMALVPFIGKRIVSRLLGG